MNIFVYIRDYRFPEMPYFLFLNVALKWMSVIRLVF